MRAWRRYLKAALPEIVRARLRGRRYGYRRARVSIPHVIEPHGASGTVPIRIEGLAPLSVEAAGVDAFQFQLRHNGEGIEEFYGFLDHARRTPGLLLDIGASHGAFSLAYCAAHDQNRSIAFEPADYPLASFRRSAAASGLATRIVAERLFLGAAPDTVLGDVDGNGMFRAAARGRLAVHSTTVDRYVREHRLHPSAIKIDVEGAELDVLLGAGDTLRTARPTVFLELHHDLLDQQTIPPGEVLKALTVAGYRFETPLGAPLDPGRLARSSSAVVRCVALPLEPPGDPRRPA
jgi:FkbM family methyltransferase